MNARHFLICSVRLLPPDGLAAFGKVCPRHLLRIGGTDFPIDARLRAVGFELDVLHSEQGVLFAVVEARLEFLRPARLNDRLTVGVKLMRLGPASLELAQTVSRDPDTLLCRGEVRVACLDSARFRPRPMPDALLRGLRV